MAPAASEGPAGDDACAAGYRRAGWWTGQRLVDRFECHVAEAPDDLALVSGRDTLSRADLWNAAGEAAEKISATVGDARRVVVVHLPNSASWMVMFLAVLRAGHVPATPPVATETDHLRRIFELIRPALAISVGRPRRASPAEAVQEAAARTGGVAWAWLIARLLTCAALAAARREPTMFPRPPPTSCSLRAPPGRRRL